MIHISEIERDVLFSPAATEGDTRPAEITSFITERRPDLVEELDQYVSEVDDQHRLSKNYSGRLLSTFADFQIVSLWRRDGKITGFATAWDRPDFYPFDTIRLLNRTYHDPEISRVSFTREVLRPATFHCVQQQVILAERMGYQTGFISREMRAVGFFQRFISALNDRSTHHWEYRKGPFLVAPDPNSDSCWQSIGAVELSSSNTDFWSHWQCK